MLTSSADCSTLSESEDIVTFAFSHTTHTNSQTGSEVIITHTLQTIHQFKKYT